MQVHKNEMYVQRGESFTMCKRIVNRDGSPYIVGSGLIGPYWLVSISNSKYDKPDRYILNKWLSLKNFLKFEITKPVNIRSLGYNGFPNTVPAGYEGTNEEYADIAVFVDDRTGEYKYWKYTGNITIGDYSGEWVNYVCRLILSFNRDITLNWIEQTYYYSISLVSGTPLREYLVALCRNLRLPVEDTDDIEVLYRKIYETDKNYVKDIDINKPLLNTSVEYPIMLPTKLYVSSNLKGGT